MDLKYITVPNDAGGGAIPGCGTIHISEVSPTLTRLSIELGLPFNLNDYTLGSTGKREYSGDIDLVLDTSQQKYTHVEFQQKLHELFPGMTARNGDTIHLKYPIVNFNSSLQGSIPRTGFVQIDFNLGDVTWEKFYHFSPGSASEYKGGHRNLAIAAICAAVLHDTSPLLDFYDRPVYQIRWKFGPKGLFRINRQGVLQDGKWSRNRVDTIIDGPYFDGNKIASLLLSEDSTALDLESLEAIILAVKQSYGLADQERIWMRMASNFYDWKIGRNFVYPSEISRYFPVNDK